MMVEILLSLSLMEFSAGSDEMADTTRQLVENMDNYIQYNFNGDYIESQAFGYLAIRSYLNLPISYPKTTGCVLPTTGGRLVKNF